MDYYQNFPHAAFIVLIFFGIIMWILMCFAHNYFKVSTKGPRRLILLSFITAFLNYVFGIITIVADIFDKHLIGVISQILTSGFYFFLTPGLLIISFLWFIINVIRALFDFTAD